MVFGRWCHLMHRILHTVMYSISPWEMLTPSTFFHVPNNIHYSSFHYIDNLWHFFNILLPAVQYFTSSCSGQRNFAKRFVKFLFRISRNFLITFAKFCETKFTKILRLETVLLKGLCHKVFYSGFSSNNFSSPVRCA